MQAERFWRTLEGLRVSPRAVGRIGSLPAEQPGARLRNGWEPAGGHQVQKFIALPHALRNLHRIGGVEGFFGRDRKGFPDLRSRRMRWEVALARLGGAGVRGGSGVGGRGSCPSRCRSSLLALSSLLNPIAPDFIYHYFRAYLHFSLAKNGPLRSSGKRTHTYTCT